MFQNMLLELSKHKPTTISELISTNDNVWNIIVNMVNTKQKKDLHMTVQSRLNSLLPNDIVLFQNVSDTKYKVIENRNNDVIYFIPVDESTPGFHIFYENIDEIYDDFTIVC